jgi:potassium channel subfamily K
VLLEVPGLTAHWYIKTQGEGALGPIVDVQPNSPFIDGSTAVSMAFGVLANLALVSRFLEKKPYISTLIAIGSLTAHDLLNVAIVLNFGIVHRINDGYTYGEAFWLTTASSIFSVICNITL